MALLAACAALIGASCNGTTEGGMSRRAQIYLAVVDAVLDNEFPAPPDDELLVVYVIRVGETTIDAAVQADVADGLHDRADVRFADERSEAIVEDDEEMPVRDDGVLVAVGDVAEEGEPVDVDVEIYRSVNDSSRFRFTLAPWSSVWTVASSATVLDESS